MSDTENSIREVLPGPNLDLNLGMPFTTLTNDTFEALFNYASIGILITNATGDIQMAKK
jgi:hypothetical protein